MSAGSIFRAGANRAWRLKAYPVGLPCADDFELFEAEAPRALREGEVLLRTSYISVDPYMRTRMKPGPGYLMSGFELGGPPIDGFLVAKVEASAAPGINVGEFVHGFLPWRELNVADAKAVTPIAPTDVEADASAGIHPSAYLGVLGLTGLSAYFPCIEIGQPKAGETAFTQIPRAATRLAYMRTINSIVALPWPGMS